MKTFTIILFICTLKLSGQRNCDLDKVDVFTYKSDSTSKIYYYTNDESSYIAYEKTTKNALVKTLFDIKFLSPQTLIKTTGYVGKQYTEVDSLTNSIRYYSFPDEKYINFPKYTFILTDAKELSRTKNKIIIAIKMGSGQFYFNYELEYTLPGGSTKNATPIDLVNKFHLTCIKFVGTDM